jgi:hypothetical protein
MANLLTNVSTSGSGLSRSSGSQPSTSSGLDNNISSEEWQSVPSRGNKNANGRSKNTASTSQSNKQTDAWTPRTVGAYHAHQGDNQRSQNQSAQRPQQSRQTDSRPQSRQTDSRPQSRHTENVTFRGVPTPRTVNDRRTALFLIVTEIDKIVAQAQSMQEFELLLSYLYEPSLQPNKGNPRFPIVERTVDERTKIVETIVSYSLWEILTPTSSFGKILAMDLSVHATFASKSKLNEMIYTIFGMATWPRWGRNGRDVVRFPRSHNDILKTVEALLKLHVSPFRINDKNETIFQTVSVSVSKGNITRETGDAIIAMVLEYSVTDADLMFGCVRTIFSDLKRKEPIHFNKSLILLAMMNPDALEKILTALFKLDLDHAGAITVNRADATFELYLNFEKLVNMIRSDEHHPDFAQHFNRNQSLINGLLTKIASFYMESLYKLAPKFVEYDVSDGNCSSNANGTPVVKSFEAIGAFAFFVSLRTDFNISKFPLKIQVGALIQSLTVIDKLDNAENITLLLNLYRTAQLSMPVKILIENAFKKANIEMKAPATITPNLVAKPIVYLKHAEILQPDQVDEWQNDIKTYQANKTASISLAPPKKSYGKPKVEPKAEPKVEPKAESKAESKAEPKAESVAESNTNSKEKLSKLATGLEKIGSDPIDFSKELPACLDDALYTLSKLVKEFEVAQVARAFLTNACANLFNDSQIDQLGQLVMHLDKQVIIKKEAFQNLLKNETDVEEILDCTQDDNWRAGDVIDAFKSVCL